MMVMMYQAQGSILFTELSALAILIKNSSDFSSTFRYDNINNTFLNELSQEKSQQI